MATNDEIVAKLPAVLAKLQETNERSAKAAELAEKRKLADLKKQQTIANKKGAAKTRADLDAIQELKDLKEAIKDREAQQAEIAKSSAGQAIALKKELEGSGKVAEDNKEFQKLSYQARKEDYAQRLKNATSPAAKKQIREEARADAKKNGSRLEKIAAGIDGLFEMGKKKLKTAALGGLAILSTLAIGGFIIALGKFLQSDSFKKLTKFIQETIIPKLMEFWEFVKDNWVEIGILISSFLAAFVIVKAAMIGAKIVKTIKAIGVAFTAVKAFFASTMLPAVTAMMIPLLPFIAIGAAISLALYSLKEAFVDARKTFEETGSIGEALKAGISKFMGTLLGFIPKMVLKLVGWVAGLFGFDDFKKKVNAIDPIEFISKHISAMITKLVDFVKLLFKDPVGAIKELVKGYIDVITDFAGFVYKKAIKPIIDWVGKLFGVKDASGQMEGFVEKKLDKIINFAEEIYNKYIKPVVDWVKKTFSFDVSGTASSIMNMLPNLSNMMPDLPTWDNIKGKIGTLLNDLLQGLAKMMDFKFVPDKVIRGISNLGTDVASSLGAEVGNKYNPKTETMEVVDTKTGVKLNAQQLQEFEASKVKRDASSSAAGGGGQTNNVDARQSSTVNTTGPSGQNRIKNERYGGLQPPAYQYEGL
jgi:hypothetical protein